MRYESRESYTLYQQTYIFSKVKKDLTMLKKFAIIST